MSILTSTRVQLTCSTCNSSLVGLGGPNSDDGTKYNNARTQVCTSAAPCCRYGLAQCAVDTGKAAEEESLVSGNTLAFCCCNNSCHSPSKLITT